MSLSKAIGQMGNIRVKFTSFYFAVRPIYLKWAVVGVPSKYYPPDSPEAEFINSYLKANQSKRMVVTIYFGYILVANYIYYLIELITDIDVQFIQYALSGILLVATIYVSLASVGYYKRKLSYEAFRHLCSLPQFCIHCDYNLHGIGSRLCPECGFAYGPGKSKGPGVDTQENAIE